MKTGRPIERSWDRIEFAFPLCQMWQERLKGHNLLMRTSSVREQLDKQDIDNVIVFVERVIASIDKIDENTSNTMLAKVLRLVHQAVCTPFRFSDGSGSGSNNSALNAADFLSLAAFSMLNLMGFHHRGCRVSSEKRNGGVGL
ncbi:hypothetical protein MRB53_016282 [Persea americana]|uniref:Uncharacterized protein n=1 Tax=Persea americana TaxID=3435 RepID=A0ACC2M2C8_PERAE|nr:hypothetical protein MRB53_016282 [Persea americana]